jgi:hypothetical protein
MDSTSTFAYTDLESFLDRITDFEDLDLES